MPYFSSRSRTVSASHPGRPHPAGPHGPGVLSADDFKSAFRNHPAGVAVITADIGAGPVGLTATSVISVSADPALVVFSLSAASSATPTLVQADTLVINLLGAGQLAVAQNFATSGIDRFADASSWSRLDTGNRTCRRPMRGCGARW